MRRKYRDYAGSTIYELVTSSSRQIRCEASLLDSCIALETIQIGSFLPTLTTTNCWVMAYNCESPMRQTDESKLSEAVLGGRFT